MPNEKTGKGKGTKRANNDNNTALEDFAIEYSKSNRATCKVCDIKISKDEVRISKMSFDTVVDKKFPGIPLWHHVNCFVEVRCQLLYFAGGEHLRGFEDLKKQDQKMVKEKMKPMKSDGILLKKSKVQLNDEKHIKEREELNKKKKEQTKLLQMHKESLERCSIYDIDAILIRNGQYVPKNYDEKLNHLADCMTFGALEPCSNCTNGRYVLSYYGYRCTDTTLLNAQPDRHRERRVERLAPRSVPKHVTISNSASCSGYAIYYFLRIYLVTYLQMTLDIVRDIKVAEGYISKWTKCIKVTQTPKRKPLEIKEGLKKCKHFSNFVPTVGVRIFTFAQLPNQEESGESSQKAQPILPLKNLQFLIYGKVSNKEEVKKRILKLGGLVVNKLNDSIAAVVSTKADVEKIIGKMKSIQAKQIKVVEESFFDLIDKDKGTIGDSLELINENNIAVWGSNPKTPVPQNIVDGKSLSKSGGTYTKSSKSGVQKLKDKATAELQTHRPSELVAIHYNVLATCGCRVLRGDAFRARRPALGVPAWTASVICFISWVQALLSKLPLGKMSWLHLKSTFEFKFKFATRFVQCRRNQGRGAGSAS
ncbi:Poly polymerase [Eumeta japonica]|uniref:NAD(+) ADP-ribosyltransferase n=1 Tax=Eumeta variegata TaxID=151549 RepID=A0A4C1V3J3_EUMVA|nr:Poly polymerase [Eumeta japonica]